MQIPLAQNYSCDITAVTAVIGSRVLVSGNVVRFGGQALRGGGSRYGEHKYS